MEHIKPVNDPLLEVENLKTYFPVYGGMFSTLRGYVHAVDDVSFTVNRGETLGLVGGKWLRKEYTYAERDAAHPIYIRACDF